MPLEPPAAPTAQVSDDLPPVWRASWGFSSARLSDAPHQMRVKCAPWTARGAIIAVSRQPNLQLGIQAAELFLNGGPIALAGRRAKVRRDGYKACVAHPKRVSLEIIRA